MKVNDVYKVVTCIYQQSEVERILKNIDVYLISSRTIQRQKGSEVYVYEYTDEAKKGKTRPCPMIIPKKRSYRSHQYIKWNPRSVMRAGDGVG